jgi:hypothetical protein
MTAILRRARSLWIWGALLALAGAAVAQQQAARPDLMGSWTLTSETAQRGGKMIEPLGPDPLGSMMLDPSGRFMLMISRRGLPNFAANRRDAGTPEENKEVLQGSLAFFGTYAVSEPDGVLTFHVEASTFPNWIGSDQKRFFTLAGNEMTWINRTPAIGAETAELVWRRAE